jgi:hypothetical protein
VRSLCFGLLLFVSATGGCTCFDSTINSSPWLRWKIFAMFGAGRLCEEMTKRGAPLRFHGATLAKGDAPPRLSDEMPVIGRFFPSQCQSVTSDERQTLTVQFAGDGYAWTPVTNRMSFTTNATVEYKPDFQKDGGTIYVWFRPVSPLAYPQFHVSFVEQPVVSVATMFTPLGMFANDFGGQIVSSELARGFTVIHESAGDDFAPGILSPPQRPSHPYEAHGEDRVTFANETADIHENMLDFIGPFEIDGAGRRLFFNVRVSGLALDVAVVPRLTGDAWRRQYQNAAGVPLPPSPPIVAGVASPGVDNSLAVNLPQGQYYVVIDNSPYVGQVAPPATLHFIDSMATVSYLVAMGDAR